MYSHSVRCYWRGLDACLWVNNWYTLSRSYKCVKITVLSKLQYESKSISCKKKTILWFFLLGHKMIHTMTFLQNTHSWMSCPQSWTIAIYQNDIKVLVEEKYKFLRDFFSFNIYSTHIQMHVYQAMEKAVQFLRPITIPHMHFKLIQDPKVIKVTDAAL